ncbi:ABC-type amino acid transport/signal transduction systems, periplasmic component/domain [Hahella chejuensis KCTC 2396]|uniref:ABC-type amino acid transport/signal transduction systems, periplasmic component/domain n=1 Tax=Hahella chejuensis (strain KCTC 2396) TaxID=349521 RepID=Q2SH07_HAHCH|nr:transporter substrate-binding domain-containing protein [Hahella chejuensis]ABC30067.1 ABC-type amino acid transport/signal transduction systems, periplasmic component/domain [Hahella chejuensis KCTC 2396]
MRWRLQNLPSFLLLELALFWCAPAAAKEVIHIGSGEWPPYISEDAPHFGPTSQIVTEAFALVDIDVEYHFHPWNRSFVLCLQGNLDATIAWEKTAEREPNFVFSEMPIITERTVFFYSKNNAQSLDEIWSPSKEPKLRIGGILGYNYGDKLDEAERKGLFAVRRSDSEMTSFRQLIKGHIDLFPSDLVVGLEILRKHFDAPERHQIRYLPEPLRIAKLYLIFSKKTPRHDWLKAQFDKGMQQLHDSGRLSNLQIDPNLSPARISAH